MWSYFLPFVPETIRKTGIIVNAARSCISWRCHVLCLTLFIITFKDLLHQVHSCSTYFVSELLVYNYIHITLYHLHLLFIFCLRSSCAFWKRDWEWFPPKSWYTCYTLWMAGVDKECGAVSRSEIINISSLTLEHNLLLIFSNLIFFFLSQAVYFSCCEPCWLFWWHNKWKSPYKIRKHVISKLCPSKWSREQYGQNFIRRGIRKTSVVLN